MKLKTQCCENVRGVGGWRNARCSRPAGHGPDGKYCKQHDPAAVAKREVARQEKFETEWAAKKASWAASARRDARDAACVEAIRSIAAGHNDPRSLAVAVLNEYGDVT